MEITEIILFSTRMHSSGMRTARLLTVSGGGGVSQHALGGGCVSQHALGGSVSQGGLHGGVCPGGVCPGGLSPSMQWGRHPPVDRQTPVKT